MLIFLFAVYAHTGVYQADEKEKASGSKKAKK